ncbi:MAG: YfbM family protein [Pirellulales bacterium]|nr:YfbM family protein [Pirellulales bacterium]
MTVDLEAARMISSSGTCARSTATRLSRERYLIEERGTLMGMCGAIYALSPQEYQKVCSDPGVWETLTDWSRPQVPCCDLQKSWHGLHYLLTGESADAPLPLGFIFASGEPIEELDAGYGAPCWISPEQAREVHFALDRLSDEELWARFDPEAMNQAGIYPMIWDEGEGDLREEYTMYFHELKKLVADAAEKNKGLVSHLS